MWIEEGFKVGIERLVNNIAIERKVSRDRAIAMIEWVLADMKRQPPTPPSPPVGETEIDAQRKAA